jgi:periplasmic protein CpxP/Spy
LSLFSGKAAQSSRTAEKFRKGTPMSSLSHPFAMSAPLARSVAIAALMGATFLAVPLTAARADSVARAPIQLAQSTMPKSQAAADATGTRAETVEQRIDSLHAALKITPDEESNWNGVAQAMRENASAMQKLTAEKTTQAPQGMTAVEDLKAYETFAQAHVDGLKNLTSSFETLYGSMSDSQKKVADQVFQNFGRKGPPSHS